jgi:hypothetical protein
LETGVKSGKKTAQAQVELTAQPARPAAPAVAAPAPRAPPPVARPTLVEYKHEGEDWRCTRFDLLAAEFEVRQEDLSLLQGLAMLRDRAWLIVRRLFGMQPLLGKMGDDPLDAQVWTRDQVAKQLGATEAAVGAELDVMRGAWRKHKPREAEVSSGSPGPSDATGRSALPKGQGLFGFDEDPVLKAAGMGHVRFRSPEEREWMVGRVKTYEKVLGVPHAKELALQALSAETQIRRVDALLMGGQYDELSPEYDKLQKRAEALSKQLASLRDQLNQLVPWAAEIFGALTLRNVISDIDAAYRAFYADKDNTLIDGLHTLAELELMTRRSEQLPEPQYRPSMAMLAAQCREGLYDPNFRPDIPAAMAAKYDRGFKLGMIAMCEELGEPLVDLEKDGPEGEYPPLETVKKIRRDEV